MPIQNLTRPHDDAKGRSQKNESSVATEPLKRVETICRNKGSGKKGCKKVLTLGLGRNAEKKGHSNKSRGGTPKGSW